MYSCISNAPNSDTAYIRYFEERKFDFFESINHSTDTNFYWEQSFFLKFAGIRPFPFDSTSEKDYTWLRNPKNLIIAFNTVKSIGLDKFISRTQYNQKNNDWFNEAGWGNKSLNELIKNFIVSDTIKSNNEYYFKFWNRRRKEGNLKIVYTILKEIDAFYNANEMFIQHGPIDTVLKSLLVFDIRLSRADSTSYSTIVLEYVTYLKSVGLNYSAYKLIFHNPKITFEKSVKDSLLATLKYDKIPKVDWKKMDDNYNGWINDSNGYLDPKRNYGP